jgi:WD40 repeat protein
MPPRVLIALIGLGLMGLAGYSCNDPGPEPAPMRMVPGTPGGQTIDFALSPDGRWVATSGSDGQAMLRRPGDDPVGGRGLVPRGGLAQGLAFSLDGSLLAAALPHDPLVRLWDLPSGRLRVPFAGHDRGAVAVGFSPDGRRLTTAGNDGMVRLWSLGTGEQLAALDARTTWPPRIAFSADGRILAASGGDNHIRVWDVSSLGEAKADLTDRQPDSAPGPL